MVLLFLLRNGLQFIYKYCLALATALSCGNMFSQAAVIWLCHLPWFTKFKNNKKTKSKQNEAGKGKQEKGQGINQDWNESFASYSCCTIFSVTITLTNLPDQKDVKLHSVMILHEVIFDIFYLLPF